MQTEIADSCVLVQVVTNNQIERIMWQDPLGRESARQQRWKQKCSQAMIVLRATSNS